MKKDDTVFLRHIIDAIDQINEYTQDLEFEDFKIRRMIQDAVVRNLEIIGEASKNVSEDMKPKYDKMPWKDRAGMRDKIAHHYFGINLEFVWATIKEDLPSLRKEIEHIILKEKKKHFKTKMC